MPPLPPAHRSPTGQLVAPVPDYEAQFRAALTAITFNYAQQLLAARQQPAPRPEPAQKEVTREVL